MKVFWGLFQASKLRVWAKPEAIWYRLPIRERLLALDIVLFSTLLCISNAVVSSMGYVCWRGICMATWWELSSEGELAMSGVP